MSEGQTSGGVDITGNGIGMILMYWRYAQVIQGAIMTVKATKAGEVEIVDLLDGLSRISW